MGDIYPGTYTTVIPCLRIKSVDERFRFLASRIRLYKSADRGSKFSKMCTGIPDAKELIKLLGRARSRKVLIILKRDDPGEY